MSETPGARLYKIRLACGDGARKAEPMEAFVARVRKATKVDYDPSTISLFERMKQKWRLDDVYTFAAVDPEKRGPVWLAFGDDAAMADAKPAIGPLIPRAKAPTGGRKSG